MAEFDKIKKWFIEQADMRGEEIVIDKICELEIHPESVPYYEICYTVVKRHAIVQDSHVGMSSFPCRLGVSRKVKEVKTYEVSRER
jgi:hypothetical protein